MRSVPYIDDTVAGAIERIHTELGADAVVLSVRRLPASGLSRLLPGRQRVEVVAGVPEGGSRRSEVGGRKTQLALIDPGAQEAVRRDGENGPPSRSWRSIGWLESQGLLPRFARELEMNLGAMHGEVPGDLEQEWALVHDALVSKWHAPVQLEDGSGRPHVFIGPAGSGKTTALCKWLTLAVLTGGKSAAVWRLDGTRANTADQLTIHGEMLGVRVERFWPGAAPVANLRLVDLPGVEGTDRAEMTDLAARLAGLPSPRIHLVLNGAYEAELLLEQVHQFSAFKPEDLILTHLDEVHRPVKFWNLVLGTNCSLRFLGGGQKIPGCFQEAAPSHLFAMHKR